ncbi:RNA 2',3'-cyclic phosphodiesterase [Noviherbaspirillum massiliense]|uniref:RNA 2',3'-cyclic phosphodiesterase n=1 Tax=Noviherbaspirillum massiliense TaxID=1465823 RepID=UPI0002D36220|nr:RNA 2',3'-cyclic phosphodiesterase [Noviherbaspirillum massiliense]
METKQAEQLRLFYALWPDDAVRSAVMKVQAPMRGRLIPYANLHVTLAFLGSQPADLLPALESILMHLPKADISLSLDRVGYFTRKRIAWIGTHQMPETLAVLHKRLSEALAQQGISFDNQLSFKPHITLARDAPPPPDTPFTPIPWRANQVALVQSKTGPDGAAYQVLAMRSLDEDVWLPDASGIGN